MKKRFSSLMLGFALLLAGCREEVARSVAPVELTPEALGHYCQMNLLEHPGPKAQVHIDGPAPAPLFFSQVRDAVAYARLPEQSAAILAIYVNDMGAEGATWETPGTTNWIAADSAFYVVGAAVEGGMGAPELVPFSKRKQAEAFVAQHGGAVLSLKDIPDAAVITPVDSAPQDADFDARLRALSAKTGG